MIGPTRPVPAPANDFVCMVSGAAHSSRTEQGRGVSRTLARAAAVADRRVTGLSREVLAELVVELGPRWQACQDARLADRPRHERREGGRLVMFAVSWRSSQGSATCWS